MEAVILFASLVWRALVVKVGVDLLSKPDNDKRLRASLRSGFGVVLWLAILDLVAQFLLAIFPFALPLYWIVFVITFFLIFSEYFGLGLIRAIWMMPILAIGDWIWRQLLTLI